MVGEIVVKSPYELYEANVPERAVLSYVSRSSAVSCAMRKAWAGAQKAAEVALRYLPTNATAHYMRGLVHEEHGELGEAIVNNT